MKLNISKSFSISRFFPFEVLLLTLITFMRLPSANAVLWVEDGITNTVGNNLGAALPYSGGNARVVISSGNLSYSGLAALIPAGNEFTLTGNSSSGKSYLNFTASPIASGNIYYAFLVQCTTLPTSEKSLTALLTTASIGGSTDTLAVYTKPSGGGYVLGLRKNGLSTTFAASPTALSANMTYLVVIKYTFNANLNSDDAVSLYINPTSGGSEPATSEVTLTGGTDATGIQFCGWINQSGGNGVWIFDTLRVGSGWTEVTPLEGVIHFTPPPIITQTLLAPEGIILRGTTGSPNSIYHVIASTNITLPASNWPAIATHSFDLSGNFDSTNPVSPGFAQQFFRIAVGGTAPPAPSAPTILNQPQNQTVILSNNATFTVTANGTPPLSYRWFFNTNAPVDGNSNLLTVLDVQAGNTGKYSVVITNNYGAITSTFAALTIGTPPTNSAQFNLVGFGEGTTGGGIIAETDAAYRKVMTPLEFALAVRDANKTAGSVKVIEILNDLDLGWNEIDPVIKNIPSTPFSQPVAPKLHPVLLVSGVSTVQISPKSGLTIFSANGAAIRHASWSIKNTANIIIRNLKFDELWEWDEESKGDYDKNNWDFIVIGVGGGTVSQLWVDHCTFTKSYDGIIDTKGGADHITYSWNKYMGDDSASNPNSFVWKQINALEPNMAAYPMYNFLRTHGFSATDIVTIIQGPDKTQAIGELSLDPVNVNACVTFHHQWYINTWDRLPRLAGGTVHNFNIYVDDTLVLAARRLRDARAAAMNTNDQNTLNNTYNFKPPINGSISTENGAMLVEKSVYIDCNWPLRNNQTDPSNPIYTGKIMALDTIYQYDSTFVRGNSTDLGNPLGPFQAPIIPFSWNTNSGTPNGQLPYIYTMDDPSDLQPIVTSPTSGAGAGVITWNKTNWLMPTY